MKIVYAFMVVFCACAVAAAPGEDGHSEEYFPHDGDVGSEGPGKLEIIHITPDKIDAVYYSQSGGGVRFMSEKRDGFGYVSVRNLLGDVLLTVHRPNSDATLVKISGWQFLLLTSTVEGVRKIDDYVIPNDYAGQVQDELKGNRIPDKILRSHLDPNSVNATRETALEELLARQEIDLIKDAAFALGRTGVTGADNPAALTFYVLAMRLIKMRDGNQTSSVDDHRDSSVGMRFKRWHCGWWSSDTHCSNNGYCCNTCPVGGGCTGMCGPGCWWCWDFVCGDCCYHQGCYDHDVCCNAGYITWGCLAPVSLSCSGFSC